VIERILERTRKKLRKKKETTCKKANAARRSKISEV
jgi:hypothetical protein